MSQGFLKNLLYNGSHKEQTRSDKMPYFIIITLLSTLLEGVETKKA